MYVTIFDKRRNEILKSLIHLYIQSVKPVSSSFIKQRCKLSISTATIRNILHELEEEGYIRQPHTSSGRIPTDKGYRYYIDSLMEEKELSYAQKERLNNEYRPLSRRVEEIINKTVEILSSMSCEAGINLFYNLKESLFKRIDLLKLSRENTLVVIVTDSGLIKSYLIKLEKEISPEKLKKISNFLNKKIYNIPLSRIKSQLQIYTEGNDLSSILAMEAIDIFATDDIFKDEYEIYQNGINYILKKPEFKDIDKLRGVLDTLEDTDEMAEILKSTYEPSSKKVRVSVGKENKFKNIQECSLVTTNYRIGERTVGILGLLGPTRMAYSKLLPLMKYISEALSNILTRYVIGYIEGNQDEEI